MKDEEKAEEIKYEFWDNYDAAMAMAQWKNEKLEKMKRLADEMYFRIQTLATDPRPLRKAMEDYHNFIINEYNE